MKKIIIASTNPVKIEATLRAFEQVFKDEEFSFEGVKAKSQVSDQPMSDKETLLGADNRIMHAKTLSPDADFYVGLEGGAEIIDGELHEFAWIVVLAANGRKGKAKSVTFIAPKAFIAHIAQGKEIGDICDIVFGQTNTKQKMGAIGLLTEGAIDRTEQYRQAVILALIPFIKKDLY